MSRLHVVLLLLVYLALSYGEDAVVANNLAAQSVSSAPILESVVIEQNKITQLTDASKVVDKSNTVQRTATGGAIHSLLVMLTIASFFGNAAFVVYVFWLSK